MTQIPLVYRDYVWYGNEDKPTSLHYHREIADVIAQRSAGRAEELMREHTMEARAVLVAHLESKQAAGSAPPIHRRRVEG